MKRRIRFLLGFVVILSLMLTACGGNKGSSEKKGAGDKKTGDKVTLTIGSWRTEDKAGYEKIIQDFEAKHPDIHVQFKPTKNTEYDTILNTKLKSGSGPDIIQLRPYAPGMKLAEEGYIEPLDGLSGLDQLNKQDLAAATGKDGKIYGVPLSVNTAQIFYNKDIFQKYGLKEPKTWDDLLAVAKKLKKNGVTPFAFGSKEAWLLSLSHGIIGPAFYGGNDFVEKIRKGEVNFKSAPFVKSLQAMKDLIPYFPKNYTGLGMDDIRNLFATGQAAMFIMGSWELDPVKGLNPDIKMGMFPMPSIGSGEPTITTWVDSSYGINVKSKHKDAAKTFIEYLATKDFGELFAKTFNRVSAVPGVKVDDPLVNQMSDAASTMATPYLILVDFNEGNPTTKQDLENDLQGMYLGKLTPEKIADELEKSAEAWYKPFQK